VELSIFLTLERLFIYKAHSYHYGLLLSLFKKYFVIGWSCSHSNTRTSLVAIES